MDDIRRPDSPQRHDYAQPVPARPHVSPNVYRPHAPQPAAQPAQQPHQQSAHQGHHQAPPHHQAPAQPQPPVYNMPVQQPPAHQQPHHQQPAHSTHQQPVHHQPATAKRRSSLVSGRSLSIAAGAIILVVAIFGAGYMLRSTSPPNTIPDSIARQVNYNLYFPSPMPAGYIYMKDTATFQIGQVYYKFANGRKRVTVNEQPMPSTKPDLSLLSGYIQFDSPSGKAAVGTKLGEPEAVVLTPTTVITMNGVGGVTTDDMRSAISSLKNIGQKPNS